MRAQLDGELDYVAEARWLERFRRAFAGDAAVVVPAVDAARSTARVLTMERLDGRALAAFADDADDDARRAVARTLFRFAFGAPLLHGIFNADPHPGNYLIPDHGGGSVGFVDFGSAAELSPEMRDADRRLFLAMVRRDGEMLRHAAHQQGLVGAAHVFEGETWRAWEQALAAPFLARGEHALSPAAVAQLIALTGELLRARSMALPAGAILLWRQRVGVLSVLAGLAAPLDFRRLLAQLLDDGRNPITLYDRWR
jgi:predicted unusual protein kinase regulating ubiquinone biosynthesis (AarF/ABC1/UbiB family)